MPATATSSTKLFSADNAKDLKVIRQKAKDRWLVCYDDSFEGDSNPAAPKQKSGKRVNRIIGVAVIIVNDQNQILVGERSGSHGAGTLALPGGHIDDNYYPEKKEKDDKTPNFEIRDARAVQKQAEASQREVKEETNLDVTLNSSHVHTTWDYFENETGKAGFENYNTFFMWCGKAKETAQLKNMEPTKCKGWRWMNWEELKDIANKVNDDAGAPSAPAAAGGDKGERLFLPLAKLVRDFPEFDKLNPGNESVSGGK